MGLLSIEGITHWSIPVNNLDEAEKFYGDLLGLNARGRLGVHDVHHGRDHLVLQGRLQALGVVDAVLQAEYGCFRPQASGQRPAGVGPGTQEPTPHACWRARSVPTGGSSRWPR